MIGVLGTLAGCGLFGPPARVGSCVFAGPGTTPGALLSRNDALLESENLWTDVVRTPSGKVFEFPVTDQPFVAKPTEVRCATLPNRALASEWTFSLGPTRPVHDPTYQTVVAAALGIWGQMQRLGSQLALADQVAFDESLSGAEALNCSSSVKASTVDYPLVFVAISFISGTNHTATVVTSTQGSQVYVDGKAAYSTFVNYPFLAEPFMEWTASVLRQPPVSLPEDLETNPSSLSSLPATPTPSPAPASPPASASSAVPAVPSSTATVPKLVPFAPPNFGAAIFVPQGWHKAAEGGQGDWTGWKFINPDDPNQYVEIIVSGCVGCYLPHGGAGDTAHAQPDPRLLLPSGLTRSFMFNHGLSVGYSYRDPDNPYPGNGVITVGSDENGYAKAEVFLPDPEHAVATRILNSFKVDL